MTGQKVRIEEFGCEMRAEAEKPCCKQQGRRASHEGGNLSRYST